MYSVGSTVKHFVGVKAHGHVFRDVRIRGRQCLHDLLRPGLRQQDRVAHEAFLLLVGIVAVAEAPDKKSLRRALQHRRQSIPLWPALRTPPLTAPWAIDWY